MNTCAYSHLTDDAVVHELDTLFARERAATARLLICMAEVDARRLYLPAGYSSMLDYCMGRYPLSRDSALMRVRAARAGRKFPVVLEALADGQLHLSAVMILSRYLTDQNVGELVATAAFKTKAEVWRLVQERFPEAARISTISPLPTISSNASRVTLLDLDAGERAGGAEQSEARFTVVVPELLNVKKPEDPASATPTRYVVQFTIDQDTYQRLEYAKQLLSHRVPDGNLEQIFGCLLQLAIPQAEKSKFGATEVPQTNPRKTASRRHVPEHVKRAVWQRDGGQCTFQSTDGRRCESRHRLEYDHMQAVAHGGIATVENLRLRCHGHNQYEAERAFGAGFMERKRRDARRGQQPGDLAESPPARRTMTHEERARGAEQARAAIAELEARARAPQQ